MAPRPSPPAPAPTGMSPMTIEEPEPQPTGKPLWNLSILIRIWIFQVIFLGIRQLGGFLQIFSHAHGTLYKIIAIIAWLGNAAIFITTPYESHKYAAGTLTPDLFFKLEVAKLAWLTGASLLLDLSVKGVLSIIGGHLVAGLLGEFLICAPFIGAVYYARKVIRSEHGYVNVVNGVAEHV